MNGFREKIQKFMSGRYGMDSLGQFLVRFILGLIIINFFLHSRTLWLVELVMIIYTYHRMLSRDFGKRQEENNAYMRLRFQAAERWKRWRYQGEQKAKYHIYKCPSCGQKIRIPRGRGRVSIHCPKCHTDFIRKS